MRESAPAFLRATGSGFCVSERAVWAVLHRPWDWARVGRDSVVPPAWVASASASAWVWCLLAVWHEALPVDP